MDIHEAELDELRQDPEFMAILKQIEECEAKLRGLVGEDSEAWGVLLEWEAAWAEYASHAAKHMRGRKT